MTKEKLQISFFIGLLLVTATVVFLIFIPYFGVMIIATVLAIIFQPLYGKILTFTHDKEWLASLITIMIIILIVLIPLSFLGILIWQESTQFYTELISNNDQNNIFAGFSSYFDAKLKIISPEISIDTKQLVSQTVSWVFKNIGTIFSGAAQFVFGFFLIVITLFYLLKDGKKIIRSVTRLSPLNDTYDAMLIKKFTAVIHSVIIGTLTVAIIQGFLVTIGFYFFGVPHGLLWGLVAAIGALIPFIGTTIVLAPAIAYLFLTGNAIAGVGLLAWGTTIVGLIDNFLAPKLMARGTQIHPLLILFSVLGGIALLGPIGFLAGPLILSLLFSLLEMYQSQLLSQ